MKLNATQRSIGKPYFSGKSPCKDCPYRTDAPLAKWDKTHFDDLLASEGDYMGKIYKCHKNNGSACKGWLMNQWAHGLPSIALRIEMIKQKPPSAYMASLSCKVKLYPNVQAMCDANFEIYKLQDRAVKRLVIPS